MSNNKPTLGLPNRNNNSSTSSAAAAQSAPGADTRIDRDTEAADSRGDRGADYGAEGERDLSTLSDEELDRLVANEEDGSVLPNPPPAPDGWHYCWLTTDSKYDQMSKRIQMGYVMVRQSELPSFVVAQDGKVSSGGDGYIRCQEMILAKMPERVYQAIMRHRHFTKPLEQEAGIASLLKGESDHKDSAGTPLFKPVGDGVDDMEERVKRARRTMPAFS